MPLYRDVTLVLGQNKQVIDSEIERELLPTPEEKRQEIEEEEVLIQEEEEKDTNFWNFANNDTKIENIISNLESIDLIFPPASLANKLTPEEISFFSDLLSAVKYIASLNIKIVRACRRFIILFVKIKEKIQIRRNR